MSNVNEARQRAQQARQHLNRSQQELDSAQAAVEAIERSCQHQFGKPEYKPDHRPAYTIPGDPPGTMGIDWQGPCHVEAKTTPKWVRQCSVCGKVETTIRTKPQQIQGEIPGTYANAQVPDFDCRY